MDSHKRAVESVKKQHESKPEKIDELKTAYAFYQRKDEWAVKELGWLYPLKTYHQEAAMKTKNPTCDDAEEIESLHQWHVECAKMTRSRYLELGRRREDYKKKLLEICQQIDALESQAE